MRRDGSDRPSRVSPGRLPSSSSSFTSRHAKSPARALPGRPLRVHAARWRRQSLLPPAFRIAREITRSPRLLSSSATLIRSRSSLF